MIYESLHKKGELGKLPGMYVPSGELDRDIPSDSTSAFFRGGIINTMACFEAYLHDLLDEAADTILYEREKCKGTCPKCKQLNYDHVVLKNSPRDHRLPEDEITILKNKAQLKGPTLNIIETEYKKKFGISNSFTEEELLSVGKLATQLHLNGDDKEQPEQKPMTYYYTIKTEKFSKVSFDNELLSAMLKFCHGIRCVMAHGNPSKALDTGALKYFPIGERSFAPCLKCDHSICKLRHIATLSDHFNTCIKEQGRRRVMKTSRLLPRPKPLRKLSDETDRNNALEIVQEFFPDLCNGPNGKENPDFKSKKEVNGNYALYHICRTYSNLKENERSMYITYRVLVRINQFILVLAHRMRIAVGRILIYKYDLPEDTWGVPKSKQGQIDKINKFEKGHQKVVSKLGKFESDSKNAPQQINLVYRAPEHQSNCCQSAQLETRLMCRATQHWPSNYSEMALIVFFVIVIVVLGLFCIQLISIKMCVFIKITPYRSMNRLML